MINMLKREKFFIEGTEFYYYSMLKNIAALLSNKIVFSDEAKTNEVKKRKLTYDLRNIIGRKNAFKDIESNMKQRGSPKAE